MNSINKTSSNYTDTSSKNVTTADQVKVNNAKSDNYEELNNEQKQLLQETQELLDGCDNLAIIDDDIAQKEIFKDLNAKYTKNINNFLNVPNSVKAVVNLALTDDATEQKEILNNFLDIADTVLTPEALQKNGFKDDKIIMMHDAKNAAREYVAYGIEFKKISPALILMAMVTASLAALDTLSVLQASVNANGDTIKLINGMKSALETIQKSGKISKCDGTVTYHRSKPAKTPSDVINANPPLQDGIYYTLDESTGGADSAYYQIVNGKAEKLLIAAGSTVGPDMWNDGDKVTNEKYQLQFGSNYKANPKLVTIDVATSSVKFDIFALFKAYNDKVLDPDDAQAVQLLGDSYLKLGNNDKNIKFEELSDPAVAKKVAQEASLSYNIILKQINMSGAFPTNADGTVTSSEISTFSVNTAAPAVTSLAAISNQAQTYLQSFMTGAYTPLFDLIRKFQDTMQAVNQKMG